MNINREKERGKKRSRREGGERGGGGGGGLQGLQRRGGLWGGGEKKDEEKKKGKKTTKPDINTMISLLNCTILHNNSYTSLDMNKNKLPYITQPHTKQAVNNLLRYYTMWAKAASARGWPVLNHFPDSPSHPLNLKT